VVYALVLIAGPASAASAFTISGQVTSHGASKGVANTEVAITEAGTSNLVAIPVTTNSEGSYSVSVPSGTYDITFTPPMGSGFATAHVSSYSATKSSELNVVLVPALTTVTWSGVLRGTKGTPLANIGIRSFGNGFEGRTTTTANGSFSLKLVAGETNGISVEGSRPSGISQEVAPQSITFGGSLTTGSTNIEQDLALPLTDLTVKTIGPGGNAIPEVRVIMPSNTQMSSEPFAGLKITYSDSGNISTTNSQGETTFAIPTNVTSESSGPGPIQPPAETQLQSTSFKIAGITSESTQIIAFAKSGTDSQSPEINCGAPSSSWHAGNVTIACTTKDTGTGLAHAEDASFSLSTSIPAGEEITSAQTDSRLVCDKADNCALAGPIGPIKIDRKAPSIVIASPASGQEVPQGSPLKAEYTCADGGSGVASCEGSTPNGASLDTSTPGTHTLTVSSTDAVGNHSANGATYSVVQTDTTPPAISATTPENGQLVNKGANLRASYTCSDGGSGIASCEGSAPNGASLDTSTLGEHTLSVAASDHAGNSSSHTVHYTVVEPGECGESPFVCQEGLGDETPPSLVDLAVSPTSVDTSNGSKAVTVTLHATDDLSGVSAVQLNLSNGSRWISAVATRTSGTGLHGTWKASLTLPKASAEGSYALSVSMIDNIGNHRTYSSTELETLALPSAVTESGPGDTTPPQISGTSASPTTLSTCSSPVSTTIGLQMSDSSGVAFVNVYLTGPHGQVISAPAAIDSGTTASGHWSASLALPAHAEQGTWSISIQTGDTAGNSTYVSSAQLGAAGFTSAVQQTCAGDTTPPQILGVSLSPESVDTSGAPRNIVVDVHASDDLSGVGSVQATLASGDQSHSVAATLQSGSSLDGTWQATITLPRWSQEGNWQLGLTAVDEVGNSVSLSPSQIGSLGSPSAISQTGEGDSAAPTASSGSISPNSFDTSQHPVPVTVRLHATDAQSGTSLVRIEFTSPSGTQHVYGEASLTSGTSQEGEWTATLEFPQFSQQGSWSPRLELWDSFGNQRAYTPAELTSIFPTIGVVEKPAPKVTKLSVKKGPAAGGTSVTITGAEFLGVSAVHFGTQEATGITVNSSTSITAIAPPGTSGFAYITVATPYGTSAQSSKARFKYANPTITSVAPASGPITGGTVVTLHGAGFAPGAGTSFTFGAGEASGVECSSTSACTAITPSAKKPIVVDVVAKVGKAKSKKSPPGDQFTFH
jgi:hypothetical protein